MKLISAFPFALSITAAILVNAPAFAAETIRAVETVEFCKMRDDVRKLGQFMTLFKLRDYLQNKHVVFVSGLMESTENEFIANTATIKAIDSSVPVTKIAPPRKVSIENNVDYLMSELKKAHALHPGRKITLFGMSKGAAEIAQLAGLFPDLFEEQNDFGPVVDAMIAINAAVGGSVFADLELNTDANLTARWEKYKRDINFAENPVLVWLTDALKSFFLDTWSPGFRSLTSAESRARSKTLISLMDPAHQARLQNKFFFVTSSRNAGATEDLPWFFVPVTGFMASEGLANDGILFEKDQIIADFGQHLVSVRNASHFNLTGNYGPDRCRREFMHYILLRLAAKNRLPFVNPAETAH